MQNYKYIGLFLVIAIAISGMCQVVIPTDSFFSCKETENTTAYISILNMDTSLLEFRTSDSYQQTSFSEAYEFSFIHGLRGSKRICTGVLAANQLLPCTIQHFSSYSWEQDVQLCIISRSAILAYIHHQDGQKS